MRLAASSPITTVVVVDAGSRVQEAKEDVTRWPDHDSGVPVPDYEISRLRVGNFLKSFDTRVKIV